MEKTCSEAQNQQRKNLKFLEIKWKSYLKISLKEARNNLKKEVWEEESDKTTLKEHNEEYPSYNGKKNEIKHQEKD